METLTSAGVPEPQAKAGVAALTRAFDEWGSGFLATKGDISDLKGEIANLKGDIADVRRELGGLKTDVNELRSDFKLVKWTNVGVDPAS